MNPFAVIRKGIEAFAAMPAAEERRGPVQEQRAQRAIQTRGRLSNDSQFEGRTGLKTFVAPADNEREWRSLDLDRTTLDRMSPKRLLELLADLSPEVSRALWDFLRFTNPGWEATVVRPSGRSAPTTAQAALDAMLNSLKEEFGSVDVVIGRLFFGAFLRGAFMAELVLGDDSRTFISLATPDPATAHYRRVTDPMRGSVWQLGQWQGSDWVALDRPTIRYIPIDPFPGSPYGRPLAAPALFTALFLLGLLHDIRRVVAQQGYPRIDISIDMAKLQQSMPADLVSDPAAANAWMQGAISDIQTFYSSLEPDDAYVHSSVVTINRPVGTVDSSSLGAIGDLITALERMTVRALKSMPLLMGMNEGTSETHANRQWEVHVAGIKALQHMAESLLERMFSLALQAQGVVGAVEWRFAELRAAELLRDQQVRALDIKNTRNEYESGWISQDEAAMKITGRAADAPEPRSKQGTAPTAMQAQAEPGSMK